MIASTSTPTPRSASVILRRLALSASILCMALGTETVIIGTHVQAQDKPAETKSSLPAAPPAPPAPSPSPAPSKPKYSPTPEQLKDLRIAQLEAVTAQQSYSVKAQALPEYQQFQSAMNRLVGACDKVKRDNQWPAGVECNVNANPVTFEVPATAPATVPATAPVPAPSNATKGKN